MTKTNLQTDALVSAALRHLRDAEHLFERGPHRSLEQVLHLTGYGPECARKACLVERWGGKEGDKALGHSFLTATEAIVECLTSLDVRAHRYRPQKWGARFPSLQAWTIESRYLPTGCAREDAVCALLAEARKAVDETVLALWADGVLGLEALTS